MAKAKWNFKSKCVMITGLSPVEYDTLWECLKRCKDTMSWNEEKGCAEIGNDFRWKIVDKKVYNTLKGLEI